MWSLIQYRLVVFNLMKGFGTSKEVTDIFCEILYLLINGKPLTTEDFQSLNINPEKVKNRNEQISFEDIMLDIVTGKQIGRAHV